MDETPKIASSQNHFGLPFNSYGLVDKQSQGVGLSELDLKTSTPQVTLKDHLIFVDTRDCVGQLSLREAQLAFSYSAVIDGKVEPFEFKQTLNNDGIVVPEKLVNLVQSLNNQGTISGFPEFKPDEPYVQGNVARFRLATPLKLVKNLEIINAIIPRDIIPMYVYFPGFVENCLPVVFSGNGLEYLNPQISNRSSTWQSPITETIEDFIDNSVQGIEKNKLAGVYWTPLRYWRAYTGPNCMPNPHTPPPYQLWNPPQDFNADNPWPFQPTPVKGQRIPTYIAKNGVVFSGYGLYDLDDFPETQEVQVADGTTIQIPLRKLILKLLVPEGQYINGILAQDLIDISDTNDYNDEGIVDDPLTQTGYGDYQRFMPGPGLGMTYQPNQYRSFKNAPLELSCSTYDATTGYLGPMPVPFPNFRGNVWGPYDRPGDRFQNTSLQLTVDELYMNGDLSNLEGNSIIWSDFDPTRESYTFEYYVLILKRINSIVRFSNFETSTNPNIRNAMRVQADGGFGAVSVCVGDNTTTRGVSGPLEISGLPNTQYDGAIHRMDPDVWVTPKKENPANWIDTLPGPQKPQIVQDLEAGFGGWMYIWRDIFPWTGQIYIPVTAGGIGAMEYYDCTNEEWEKSGTFTQPGVLTTGSSQWSASPVIGASNEYCIPTSNTATSEYSGNVAWGQVTQIQLVGGGTNYQDSFADFPDIPRYRLVLYSDQTFGTEFVIRVDSVNPTDGQILTFTRISGSVPAGDPFILNAVSCDGISCSNPTIPTTGNNAAFRTTGTITFVLHSGGSNYTIEDDVATKTQTGGGTGLTVNITSLTSDGPNIPGIVASFEISNPGSGYVVGDKVLVFQGGSDNNAMFEITETSGISTDIIPQYSIFHYIDPLAVGPASGATAPTVDQNYVNGVDTCTMDCPDNCTLLQGEYQVCVGESVEDSTTAFSDPRPIPDPKCLLKCDFVAQDGPDTEWQQDINNNIVNCRPLDNIRLKQRRTYIDRRISFNDLGSNNGFFITGLLNYRTLFVSSVPDTDIIIKIRQAKRTIYTQSQNPQVDNSNFFLPIRLNLGSTSGTLEYVEAVQGTLTSAGVYWKKDFFPPQASLDQVEFEFFTYDGTPIPIERTLGFNQQINEQAILLASSIVSSSIYVGSYTAFAPNPPPVVTTNSPSPSASLLSGARNSKSLTDPFNSTLAFYTQRNLSLTLKSQIYQGENPGITEIIKKMPEALIQQSREEFQNILPLASNIDDYDELDDDEY